MPVRLPSTLRPSPSFFNPSYRSLARPASSSAADSSSSFDPARPARRYSCSSSSSGRSSSRDGNGSGARVKAPAGAGARPSSSTSAASPSGPAPARAAATVPKALPRAAPAAFNLPHANAGLVNLDAFYALHRPLLELPVQLGNRRSTQHSDVAELAEWAEPQLEETRPIESDEVDAAAEEHTVTVAELSAELAEVVDLSEDGTPLGVPYLARVKPAESLKSLEEELAAEAQEEEALALHEEQLHDMEKDQAEPYDAWMIGQHQPQPHSVARYLAVHPPFETPTEADDAPLSSAARPQPPFSPKTLSDLTFLSPFGKPAPSPAVSPSPPSSSLSAYAPAFSKQFLRPLDPSDASAVSDQFLSHAQLTHRWQARSDFILRAGEALRRAEVAYSGDAPSSSSSANQIAKKKKQRGSIRLWSEKDGWVVFDLARGGGEVVGTTGSPFLPAEMVDLDAAGVADVVVEMDSVKRKRKKKMSKHKYKKRRKAQRALRQRLGK
ncbi:hypothetical protein JCM21900_004617 [Sporobolomyces salmonicolor]